jgi:hypothetical protein
MFGASVLRFSGPNTALGRLLVKTHFRKIPLLSLVLVGLVIAGAGVASAQDVYKVNYFDINAPVLGGLPVPDATVRIDNPGLTYGNLCAEIFIFAADQQMAECCGCIETHNGLRKLSVRNNLTSNPLTGAVPFSGVIKVVSASPNSGGACDPTSFAPKANLRVWATHIQNGSSFGAFPLVWPTTETESSDSTLGAAELSALQAQCTFINILGSGHGLCSCGTGD